MPKTKKIWSSWNIFVPEEEKKHISVTYWMNKLQNINYKTIIIIGLFQVLALIPGVSRAGIIITAARFLNFNRYDATKISFLLSIPALLGASVINLNDVIDLREEQIIFFSFSVLFSFLFSYLTIKYFLKFISMSSMTPFVVYRIFLSLFLFILIFF